MTEKMAKNTGSEWRIILDTLRKTDPILFVSILRKLLHQLYWKGVREAEHILNQYSIGFSDDATPEKLHADENRPQKVKLIRNYDEYVEAILSLTYENFDDQFTLELVQKWMQDNKSSELVRILESQETSLPEISEAIRKYFRSAPEKFYIPADTIKGLRVSLIRRFFTERLDYIMIAKEYLKLTDFYSLIKRVIFPPMSHGQLGGKSAGLFLAKHILDKDTEHGDLFDDIETPKTWYLTSDVVLYFMKHNQLEEVLEQKYKDLDEIRMEYPHLVQLFKNAEFTSDILNGLSAALDDFGDVPIIVRSSSLMEDQTGASFSGKYKSLFLANQGTKKERLEALTDAISEVYASIFSPDPLEYRAEKDLLDFHEEMGIMIQEVVGAKVGKYYFPAFAGVAFSNNEFRWSPRINREDGLIRMVVGLGTRAVDRIGDDYPILGAPGQPNLKVNVTLEEAIRYSPKKIDVINLETNNFETVEIIDLIQTLGDKFPDLTKIFSVLKGSILRRASLFESDFRKDDFIVTFDGILSDTKFLSKIDAVLKTLQSKMKTPVDIEFASINDKFYLLQCRPQSYAGELTADLIPDDYESKDVLFSSNRYVSNGKVPEISHLVYVDPKKYSQLPDSQMMMRVARAIGKLNKILPRRKFILIGPGRWGSRGDIKLGVATTYSDINNTAMLIEVAMKKGDYVPDLSFGTHFFQDLVEASIRYLPIYPDEKDVVFNESFFDSSTNSFADLLPNFSDLKDVVKVIDIQKVMDGKILKVYMNAELERALAVFKELSNEIIESKKAPSIIGEKQNVNYWEWRFNFIKKFANNLDGKKFGVKDVYLFGSTKQKTARADSDINLLIHVTENFNKKDLELWLDGWDKSLIEINYLMTHKRIKRMLNYQFVTDDDVLYKRGLTIKIGAATNSAMKLTLKHN